MRETGGQRVSDLEIERVDEQPAGSPDGSPRHGIERRYFAPRRLLPSDDRSRHSSSLTVADGVMLLIGVAAVVLRFGELTRLPLSAAEAAAALANWQFRSAVPLSVPVVSPAYFAFTHLVMSLGADGDAAARLVPAVFGLLTALLPWALRGRARPAAWLTAALFLAVSPLLVAVSRTAGGDAIALFALGLLAISSQWGDRSRRVVSGQWSVGQLAVGRRRPAVVAGVALGLGLASSPLFYSGLAALAAAAWVMRRTGDDGRPTTDDGRPTTDDGRADSRPPTTDDGPATDPLTTDPLTTDPLTTSPLTTDLLTTSPLSALLLAAALTFLAVATSFLLYPAGLGAALRLFPAWLGQFALPGGNAALSPFLALLRYEPALLVLGAPAAAWVWSAGGRAGRAVVAWTAAALLVILLQPGIMVNAAAALLPGYWLIGMAAAALAAHPTANRRAARRVTWLTAGALVLLGALLLAAGGRVVRLNLLAGETSMIITLAALAFVLAGLAVVLAMAWESPAARRGAFVGVAALLLFWQWGAAWQLSRQGANDPRERWVTEGTDDDARAMAALLLRVSRQTVKSDSDLDVFSLVDSPVLGWYLRDLVNYRAGATLPVNAQPDVVIAPAGAEPALYSDYFGADFDLMQREVPVVGRAAVGDVLKWWLFRESAAPAEMERVVIWVRSDLAAAK